MNDNPYAAPQSQDIGPIGSGGITQATVGNFVFGGLGLVLCVLSCFAIISENQDSNFQLNDRYAITLGASFLAMLGALLIAHGIIRNETTEKVIALALFSFVGMMVIFLKVF